MYLGKLISLIMVVLIAQTGFAQTAKKKPVRVRAKTNAAVTKPAQTPAPAPTPAPVADPVLTPPPQPAPVAKAAPRTLTRFAVGAGYMVFSEGLRAEEAGGLETAIANYSGIVFYGEHSWTKPRWINQVALGVGVGKASAGFVSINYPDAVKRAWTLGYFEVSTSYRINPKISLGAGLIGGTRSGDWKSEANTGIRVLDLNKTIYAPEFIMRWNASRRFTIVQSISTPDFRGTTMWRWTSQYNF